MHDGRHGSEYAGVHGYRSRYAKVLGLGMHDGRHGSEYAVITLTSNGLDERGLM